MNLSCSFKFGGLGVALVTPFMPDGQIDWTALERIVENLIGKGADYLCVLGTTAETPTLSQQERMDVLRFVIKCNGGRLPVLAGCSSNCTYTAVEQTRLFCIDGVDAILTCVPFYNKPSQEGVYRHFKAIAQASEKPLVLYNVPGRTGINMTAATTLRLAREFSNIIGIKEASGKMDQIKELIDGAPSTFHVISGDDSLALESMRMGAAGVISVIGNAIPATFSRLIHSRSDALQQLLQPLYGLLFKEGNPSGVKALMASRGMLHNVLRLPMVPVSDGLNREIVEGFAGITE